MQDSKLDRIEIFVASAIIGCEVEHFKSGFRHRDILFMIDLFTNWVEFSLIKDGLYVQNAQLLRFLNQLLNAGCLKKISKKGYPRYKLTRIGLVELTTKIVHHSYLSSPAWFFFAYHFITSYRERIFKMIKAEGQQFPLALKLECEELLNTQDFVARETSSVKKEILKLQERINDSIQAKEIVTSYLKAGKTLQDAIKKISEVAPYDLTSQKPLNELIEEIPADLREWELTEGNLKRASLIYEPSLHMLECYLKELEKLK